MRGRRSWSATCVTPWRRAAADDDVRVIVLTGAGRAFCAGADMDALKGLDPNDIRRAENIPAFDMNCRPDWQTRYGYYPSIGKPIIGMLNGATAGIGLVHALYCDLRFAADNTVFTTAFSRRGLIAEHGISWMLPRLVGHANALDLLMSARRVYSDEALRIGLVNRLYPPDQLAEQTYAYARDLADFVSPSAISVIKRQLYDVPFQSLAEATIDANREMVVALQGQRFQGRRGELYGEAAAEVYGEVGRDCSISPSSPAASRGSQRRFREARPDASSGISRTRWLCPCRRPVRPAATAYFEVWARPALCSAIGTQVVMPP